MQLLGGSRDSGRRGGGELQSLDRDRDEEIAFVAAVAP